MTAADDIARLAERVEAICTGLTEAERRVKAAGIAAELRTLASRRRIDDIELRREGWEAGHYEAAQEQQGKAGGVAVARYECRECDNCGHAGINDASTTDGACFSCEWSGPEPVEDKCPGCGDEGCMTAACPKCGARYRLIAELETAAPPAHSPDAGVTHEMVERGLNAQPFASVNNPARVWQLINLGEDDNLRLLMRAALSAALAPPPNRRTPNGEPATAAADTAPTASHEAAAKGSAPPDHPQPRCRDLPDQR